MPQEPVTYARRSDGALKTAHRAAGILPNWRGEGECWLFVAAHDDDIAGGAGLALLAALEEGVAVHALITTDGRMGYCTAEEKTSIVKTRRAETEASFRILGVADRNVHFLGFPDCDLASFIGRRPAAPGDPTAIEGYAGLQNAYTHHLRRIAPTRVFVPTIADLHPDHKTTNEEMLMSIFHACGPIWPELGQAVGALPEVYEYVTYVDFPEPPGIKITTSPRLLEKKIAALLAYESQKQIGVFVDGLRKAGPVEYLRELRFRRYSPARYEGLFETTTPQFAKSRGDSQANSLLSPLL